MHWNEGQVSGARDEDLVTAFRTLCGRPFEREAIVTLERELVTCKACLKLLAKRDAAEPAPVIPEAFDPTPYHPAPAQQLTQRELRIIERSEHGDDAWRDGGWGTVLGALSDWSHAVDAGVLQLASSSDPARFGRGAVRGGSGSARVTAAMSAIEHVVDVERGLAQAYEREYVVAARTLTHEDGTETRYPEFALAPRMQRSLLEHRVCGRPIRRGLRGDAIVRVECPAEDLAIEATRALGLELGAVTAHHVGRVVRHGLDRVEAYLHARGVVHRMRPKRRQASEEGETMRVPGYDLNGWKAIAGHLEVSEDTARRYAGRDRDPLPIRRALNGQILAASTAVDAWAKRQVEAEDETAVA